MAYGRNKYRPRKSRQSGSYTGSSFSGMQDIIRHSNQLEGTLATDTARCFSLVCYNPTNHGTPVPLDGSSAKVLTNNFTAEGSRVNSIAINLTIKQTDTSKNNTVYTGVISTSFNEGQLSSALMTTNFNDFITSNAAGEMSAAGGDIGYNMHTYSLKDIQQHNIRGLMHPAHHLYSGRVVTLNQNLPLPRKNRRQQNGSGLWLVVCNDSDPEGTNIDYRLDTFFKEIPANAV